MRIASLVATLAFAMLGFALPAAADSTANASPAAATQDPASLQVCLAKAKGDKLAQLDCCKGHKGVRHDQHRAGLHVSRG